MERTSFTMPTGCENFIRNNTDDNNVQMAEKLRILLCFSIQRGKDASMSPRNHVGGRTMEKMWKGKRGQISSLISNPKK